MGSATSLTSILTTQFKADFDLEDMFPSPPHTEVSRSKRLRFLNSLKLFGILCHWPSNVTALKATVGKNVVTVYLEIYYKLSNKVEILLMQLESKTKGSCSAEDVAVANHLLEDIIFVSNTLPTLPQ